MVEKPSWGGSEQLIYARGPSLLVTGVTTLRVTRRKGDLLRVAVRIALRRSQLQIPGLSHQVVPEAVMRLLVHEAEAGLFVDAPGGMQHVVGPQREPAVAALAGEAPAFAYKALADPEPARPGLDQEQTQLRDRLRFLDAKHPPHVLTVQLRDPAALPLRVVLADELGHDVSDQGLEMRVPTLLLGVQRAVARDGRAHRARGLR